MCLSHLQMHHLIKKRHLKCPLSPWKQRKCYWLIFRAFTVSGKNKHSQKEAWLSWKVCYYFQGFKFGRWGPIPGLPLAGCESVGKLNLQDHAPQPGEEDGGGGLSVLAGTLPSPGASGPQGSVQAVNSRSQHPPLKEPALVSRGC